MLTQSAHSPPTTLKIARKKEQISSRFVNPQAVQLSPGLVMGSQVSSRQKRDLAKYYTSLLGNKEQHSVNAYMQIGPEQAQQPAQKKKRKNKKKRAMSHAGINSVMHNVESQKNLLTIEQDKEAAKESYGMDDYQATDVSKNLEEL